MKLNLGDSIRVYDGLPQAPCSGKLPRIVLTHAEALNERYRSGAPL